MKSSERELLLSIINDVDSASDKIDVLERLYRVLKKLLIYGKVTN